MHHHTKKLGLLAVGLMAAACGPREDPSRQICQGTESLMAAVQVVGGHLSSEDILWVENGHAFFLIDGTCRYAVKTHGQREVRTGVLTPEEEEALAVKLGYRAWASFEGDWSADFGAPDAGALQVWDHLFLASCTAGCRGSAPVELRELSVGLSDFLAPYWEQGTPFRGESLRLVVVEYSRTAHEPYAWPLSTPVTEFMLPEGQYLDIGSSFEVSGADAAALRELQADFLARTPEIERDRPIPILTEDGLHVGLQLRESLPWEDHAGMVRQSPRR